MSQLSWQDKVWWWLGFNKITRMNTEPPPKAYVEREEGVFVRPGGCLTGAPIIRLNLKGRLRAALGGYVQIGFVIWTDQEVAVRADMFLLALPPPGTFKSKQGLVAVPSGASDTPLSGE